MRALLRRLSVGFERLTREWVLQQWVDRYPDGLTAALNSGSKEQAVEVYRLQVERYSEYDPELLRVKIEILDRWDELRSDR